MSFSGFGGGFGGGGGNGSGGPLPNEVKQEGSDNVSFCLFLTVVL